MLEGCEGEAGRILGLASWERSTLGEPETGGDRMSCWGTDARATRRHTPGPLALISLGQRHNTHARTRTILQWLRGLLARSRLSRLSHAVQPSQRLKPGAGSIAQPSQVHY